MLIQNDYEHEVAMKLSGFIEGNNLDNVQKKPEVAPQPDATQKTNN
jgi:hypothetical protein